MTDNKKYVLNYSGNKVAKAINNALQADEKFTAFKTEITDRVNDVEAVAKGRAAGYVFNTKADMDEWLTNSENVANLVLGDNLYIRAIDVPDYWWDGEAAQQLETQKIDLTEYAKTVEIPTKISDLTDDLGLSDKENLTDEQLQNIEDVPNKVDKDDVLENHKGSVRDSIVTIRDASPYEHTLKVKVTDFDPLDNTLVMIDKSGQILARYEILADGTVVGVKSVNGEFSLHTNDYNGIVECEYVKNTAPAILVDIGNLENKKADKADVAVKENWELISRGELTKEVSSLALNSFSCSKVALSIEVKGSATNSTDTAMQVRTNINANAGGGSDGSLTRMFRTNPDATATPAQIYLEMQNKWIAGTLVNSSVNVNYFNREGYDSITGLYLAPVTSGIVFGVGTTYELWGVRE